MRKVLMTGVVSLITMTAVGGVLVTSTPCEYEDSHWCYWDASAQGNGVGHDFVDIAGWVVRF